MHISKAKYPLRRGLPRQRCDGDFMRCRDNGQMCHWARPIEIMDLQRGKKGLGGGCVMSRIDEQNSAQGSFE